MRILLVNTNRMQPPVSPVGLDYVGAALQAQGHHVELLDLCFAEDQLAAIDRQLAQREYALVGLSFRNTDDCYYPGRGWFVPELARLVQRFRQGSAAKLVLGGVGFSIMPGAILRLSGADAGIAGEGELALGRLAQGDWTAPGLIHHSQEGWELLPPEPMDLAGLPPMRRDFIDNPRYYRQGGQSGFETKRGCAAGCIYCADPAAKGRSVRLREPAAVAEELAALADMGVLHLHTCDAEFNRPLEHALAVCEALARRRLGERLRWYAYCAVTPFPDDLALAMRRAGCVGINFGADAGDGEMLRRLGRDYQPHDVQAAVACCRRQGIICMTDMLLGGPGETAQSVRRTLEFMRQCAPDRIGLSVGVRVYPGTPLARLAAQQPEALRGPGAGSGDFVAPTFYLSPALGEGIFALVTSLVGDDRRFFFSDPTAADRNYNYSSNEVLVNALARGYRGAYWDILRRLQDGLPPE
jgi:radical SAM superfamily enzyme YgiQ (UPF0313 family)